MACCLRQLLGENFSGALPKIVAAEVAKLTFFRSSAMANQSERPHLGG
jgi:hypothetical protein